MKRKIVIKALSVKDPWAELIRSGQKMIETRTWNTKYRGPLLIVKSLKPTTFDNGLAVCVVNIVNCRPMVLEDEKVARCPIYPNAKSWQLSDVFSLTEPFPVKGKLSLFNVETDNMEVVETFHRMVKQNIAYDKLFNNSN